MRVIGAPCAGRCEQAPVAVVGQNPMPNATIETVSAAVMAHAVRHVTEEYIGLAECRAHGGYELLAQCLSGQRDVEAVIKEMENSGLRGLGGAGFPAGRKWRIVRA